MSKGIFGNMFDFNGDGDLDIFEQATEFAFLQKMMEDEEKDDSSEDTDDSDLSITLSISLGSGDDDSDEDWRDQYYGDEIGLDPDDYDTEEEYQEAAAEKEPGYPLFLIISPRLHRNISLSPRTTTPMKILSKP